MSFGTNKLSAVFAAAEKKLLKSQTDLFNNEMGTFLKIISGLAPVQGKKVTYQSTLATIKAGRRKDEALLTTVSYGEGDEAKRFHLAFSARGTLYFSGGTADKDTDEMDWKSKKTSFHKAKTQIGEWLAVNAPAILPSLTVS